jgi:hypothetical protein
LPAALDSRLRGNERVEGAPRQNLRDAETS